MCSMHESMDLRDDGQSDRLRTAAAERQPYRRMQARAQLPSAVAEIMH